MVSSESPRPQFFDWQFARCRKSWARLNGDLSVKDRLKRIACDTANHYDFIRIAAIRIDGESSYWANRRTSKLHIDLRKLRRPWRVACSFYAQCGMRACGRRARQRDIRLERTAVTTETPQRTFVYLEVQYADTLTYVPSNDCLCRGNVSPELQDSATCTLRRLFVSQR
jgi:hypothetical protein